MGYEILANTTTENPQELTQIAVLPNGGFVIAWNDWNDNDYHDIFKVKAQVFGPGGNKIGDEILVNTVTDNYAESPRIAVLPNSDFLIFWTAHIEAFGNYSVFSKGQLFNASGTKIGNEFLVNIQTEDDLRNESKSSWISDISVLPDGKIIVSLFDQSPTSGGATAIDDASGSAVKAQIF